MELTKKQFDVLSCIATEEKVLSQRNLHELTKLSLGTVNTVLKELNLLGYTENGTITDKGLNALEPYKVKRAIFLAAGFGCRLVPVTLNTPKPLVRVNGTRIIDTLIDACLKVGINEIYVVRGYLAEQFDQLLYKYPMVKFITNEKYNESNNISSALIAKDLFENAYVFESDLLLSNEKIVKKYCYTSNFLAIKTDRTDDWCFESKNGIITKEKMGGTNCWQMVGISYWNKEDGKQLKEDIERVFNLPGGKEKYWEQVPLITCKQNYKVAIRECLATDVIEIDTFNELKAIDKSYES